MLGWWGWNEGLRRTRENSSMIRNTYLTSLKPVPGLFSASPGCLASGAPGRSFERSLVSGEASGNSGRGLRAVYSTRRYHGGA
jgi:hypothetical protein